MIWLVHFRTGGVGGMLKVHTLPEAIKYACDLLDRGTEISKIESAGGLKGMNAGEIMLACAERKANGSAA